MAVGVTVFSVAAASAASQAPQSVTLMLVPPLPAHLAFVQQLRPFLPPPLTTPAPAAPSVVRLALQVPERDVQCLASAVYFEARGEGDEGEAAVAQVVLNRVRAPAFPKSVCGVVYQGQGGRSCQFTFACGHSGKHEPAAWEKARDIARRALGGYVMRAVGGATNFHVARLGAVWGSRLVQVAHIGQHVFFASGRGAAAPSAPFVDVSTTATAPTVLATAS